MSLLQRWASFNLVGVLGMAVQLSLLAALQHTLLRTHPLLATALALEITLLHNVCWHRRYTWRDRAAKSSWRRSLVHFHLSNGFVSLVGNLVIMRWLMGRAHMPPVAANAIAIAICSLLNFLLGEKWTFKQARGRLCQGNHCPCKRMQRHILNRRNQITRGGGGRLRLAPQKRFCRPQAQRHDRQRGVRGQRARKD